MRPLKLLFSILITCYFFLIQLNTIHAQISNDSERNSVFLDEEPKYQKWKPQYILNKIVYTNTETIFYFTFKTTTKTASAVFYPLDHRYSWVIIDTENKLAYHPKSIQKIKKNGLLIHKKIGEEPLSIPSDKKNTVFTCQIHFDRFREKTKVVDLIEGLNQKKNKNHFNCFKIELKHRTPPIE